jgi:hypothetical protein
MLFSVFLHFCKNTNKKALSLLLAKKSFANVICKGYLYAETLRYATSNCATISGRNVLNLKH